MTQGIRNNAWILLATQWSRAILVLLVVHGLTGCASEIQYAPKDPGRLDDPEQERRVFYDGWLHPGRSPESNQPINRRGLSEFQ